MQAAMNEDRFKSADGLRIFYRHWRPQAPPRAAVVICHGFNAHSGQYEWAAQQLCQRELAVFALDLRGRGQSDGDRAFVHDIGGYVDDLRGLISIARSREPALPIILLGHSAGGVVSCVYTLDRPAEISGLICESFAFQVPAPDLALAVIKGVSRLAPRAKVLRLKNEDFSRDSQWVRTMNADPLVANEAQPASTVAAMVRANERLKNEFSRITLPLLILHGTADKVTRASGSRFFYDTAGSQDKTLKLYDGHFHDLLNDVSREEVMEDVGRWIVDRFARRADDRILRSAIGSVG